MAEKRTNHLDDKNIPTHVAIIMDGNGRWATKKGVDRISGHREGMKSVRSVLRAGTELGIQMLTLFAFSEQNWKRPKLEVDALMELLKQFLLKERRTLVKNGIRLNAIGRLSELPEDVFVVLDETIEMTKGGSSLILTLALSYGGREEIVDAVKEIISRPNIRPEDINEQNFPAYLYTVDLPDPDLLIRTSGEFRLSNFLLWQLAYTEIYFTKTLWPDFRKKHLIKALSNYQSRERRFGLTSDQAAKRKAP